MDRSESVKEDDKFTSIRADEVSYVSLINNKYIDIGRSAHLTLGT